MKLLKIIFLVGAAVLGTFTVASALERRFDPNARCILVLGDTSEANLLMASSWASGHLAPDAGKFDVVDMASAQKLVLALLDVCRTNFSISFADAVQKIGAAQAGPDGSEAQARAMLSEFLKPTADRVALTAAIMPSEADVHAVYAEPLASQLWASYRGLIKPGLAFGPKQGQTELLVVYTTTARMKGGDAILREFPGGYKDVVSYMQGDFPIVRFKFVEPGKTLGMAYDGLVFVNGRWAIIPKPWRALN